MKALLMKDLMALKSSLKLFLAATGVYLLLFSKDSPETVAMVLTLMTFFLNLNSLSYDEKANWNAFALTLPLSRKKLAASKYLLARVLFGAALALALLLGLGLGLAFPQLDVAEYCVATLAMMGALMLLQTLVLPVSLKWGTEKGRLMLLIFFGLGALALMFGGSQGQQWLEELFSRPALLSVLAWSAPGVVAAAFGASYLISAGIMERKEF